MHIAHIIGVRLGGQASEELSYAAFTKAQEWLSRTTARDRMPSAMRGAIGEDLSACLHLLAAELDTAIPSHLKDAGLKPKHLVFKICDQEIQDGYFWPGSFENRAYWFSAGDYMPKEG